MLNTSVQSSPAVQSDDDAVMREHRRKRLKNIIISRLKETRDLLETRDVLGRSWKTGGMEFQQEQIERVVKEIELARVALAEELTILRAEAVANRVERGGAEFETTFEKHMEELAEPELPAAGKEELLAKQASSVQHPASSVNQIDQKQSWELKAPHLSRFSLNPEPYTLNASEIKPRVDSVVTTQPVIPKPRLVGPIDELANMTIEDFRRLGNPIEATKKIVEKVDLLAADSLLEQKKAIDAWKRSEVYKTYLGIGTESLEKKQSVGEVIEGRQKHGSVTLTSEEFNQVAEVNRKISFSR